jgi:Kdo2-lipid IVA lauroyltransferase/acyltransferase
MILLFKILARLPFWLLHGFGWLIGWLTFLVSASYRRTLIDNSRQAGYGAQVWLSSVGEHGKMLLELPKFWFDTVTCLTVEREVLLKEAVKSNQGTLVLTPHMGSFELAVSYFSQNFQKDGKRLTVLFTPTRMKVLRPLMDLARKAKTQVAPASVTGVRQIIRELRSGHCVGILPDQVPPDGQGVWASFFDRDAYTMTLAVKLAKKTQCAVLFAWVERKSWGRGFVLHIQASTANFLTDSACAVQAMNEELEAIISLRPQQYLWSYDRYRVPRN